MYEDLLGLIFFLIAKVWEKKDLYVVFHFHEWIF